MSKFLKAIVNIFLIAAILVAAAILVPPVLGITTTIIDTREMETNLPLGSITYSEDVEVMKIESGDEILKEDANSTYAYVVVEGSVESGKFTVLDASDKDGATTEVTIRSYVSRVIFTVPFIGYIVVAMQSVEGMIIVGLVVLFVIILFVLSELWKNRDNDDDDDDDDEDEENNFVYEDTAEKVKKALDSTAEDVALYGHLDDEETKRDVERLAEEPSKRFAETAEPAAVPGGKTAEFEGRTQEAAAAAEAPAEEELEEVPEEPADNGDRIMPVERLTLEEIVEQVKRSGAEPTVRRDPVTGIDIVDLSEVL